MFLITRCRQVVKAQASNENIQRRFIKILSSSYELLSTSTCFHSLLMFLKRPKKNSKTTLRRTGMSKCETRSRDERITEAKILRAVIKFVCPRATAKTHSIPKTAFYYAPMKQNANQVKYFELANSFACRLSLQTDKLKC